jgi:acyl-coenzyme A synthetase/AMP-(fatty) acid ligase
VEHVLGRQDGVLAGAVGVADRHGDRPALIGFVVPRGAGLDPQRVRAGMLEHLPAAAVPRTVLVVDSLPTQPSGKTDRRALDEMAGRTG